ncbi:MAG TPA: hypothetical protein VFN14_02760 [Candidatus Limnocylindria bacterium]|nr:hypothetical protein [Candidatus Limnocylindria bacterium]
MLQSLKRTFLGPSRDPRMLAYISRPLPRDLPDDDVVAALDIAFRHNPDPGYLVETLRPALLEVTGHDYEVLDRSVRDVTGAFTKTMVMIRDGDIGLWPGFAARSYPLIRPSDKTAETATAIAGADAPPQRKPGWEPPAPTTPQERETIEHSAPLVGGPDGEHQ